MNVNEVMHSEVFKSNIKVDADGKWFSLALIVFVIVVIVDNYNEPGPTASKQTIHEIVDKQEWYTNNFTLAQTGGRYFSVYCFWHLRDQKCQFLECNLLQRILHQCSVKITHCQACHFTRISRALSWNVYFVPYEEKLLMTGHRETDSLLC